MHSRVSPTHEEHDRLRDAGCAARYVGSYEAGPEGLEILVIGAPNLGEAPREDVEAQRDWWAD